MKKTDRLFIATTALCAAMLTLIVAENIQAGSKTRAAATPATGVATPDTQDAPDPARSEELRKKFEELGLPLHEGKYWK